MSTPEEYVEILKAEYQRLEQYLRTFEGDPAWAELFMRTYIGG
jgi:hypothetical protein